MLRIDLRQLDPARIDSDEDHVAFGFASHYPETKLDPDPTFVTIKDSLQPLPDEEFHIDYLDKLLCPACNGEGCPKCLYVGEDFSLFPKKEESRGEWAEKQAKVVDAPELTYYSLRRGSLAYRGSIPAVALSIDLRQQSFRPVSDFIESFNLTGKPKTYLDDTGNPYLGLIADDWLPPNKDFSEDQLTKLTAAFKDWNIPVSPIRFSYHRKKMTLKINARGSILEPKAAEFPDRDLLKRMARQARVEAILSTFPESVRKSRPAPKLEDIDDRKILNVPGDTLSTVEISAEL
jgi:hypothetical protein